MTTQLTAVIMARYSPRNEKGERGAKFGAADRERNSCDVQIADLVRHAEAQGYAIDEKLIFRDDAKSGKSEKNRPGLAGALAACGVSLDPRVELPRKRNRIFLCRDSKRLARNMLDAFYIIRLLTRRGVLFETLRAGRFDPSDRAKFITFGIDAIMAEADRVESSKVTGEKVRRYQNEDNRRMSKIAPYGKRSDPLEPSRWIDDPKEQAAIALIIAWKTEGRSLREIARLLPGDNRGNPWGHKIVSRILDRVQVAR